MKTMALLALIALSVSGCGFSNGCCGSAPQYTYTTSYCCTGCGCGSGSW